MDMKMTTWTHHSDRGWKTQKANSKICQSENVSENMQVDLTEDFSQAFPDTEYTENLSDDLLLPTEHKENTPRKKAKRTEKTRRLGNWSTKKLKFEFDEDDFFQNLIDSSSSPSEDEIPVKPSPNPPAEKIAPVSAPQPTVIPVVPQALMSGKNKSSMNIDQIANAITNALTIILHDNCLYYYTGKCYQIIEDSEDLLRIVRSKVRQDAFSSYSKKKFDDLFTYMRIDERLIPDDYEEKLQKSADYVSLKNGVLNLKKLKLLAHNKKFLIFYSLDADWIEEPESQSFDGFLSTISGGSPEIKTRIIESLGYLLSSCNKGKCFFVMGTAPNSGKSTLGEFLQKTLGNKLVTSKSIAQIPGRFSMGDIQGKLLNLSLDLPKGKLTPIVVSIIKQITGGDSISIERKYDKLRDIHSTMRFLFASNYPVTISHSDEDDAFWARMIVIPFLYTIEKEEADTETSRKLLQEKDDIISICLRALSNVVNNHYIFSPYEAADKLKERWRYQECDSIESIPLFVEEYLEVTGEPTDMVYSRQLYEIYYNFCEEFDFSPLRYRTFISWFCFNINGCSTKRRHETGKNPMAALTGIRIKQ